MVARNFISFITFPSPRSDRTENPASKNWTVYLLIFAKVPLLSINPPCWTRSPNPSEWCLALPLALLVGYFNSLKSQHTIIDSDITTSKVMVSRSQWWRGLRRWSAAARLLRLWVRIPRGGAWKFVCCECCVICCQVEVSATSWSLVKRSPTDRCASCVI